MYVNINITIGWAWGSRWEPLLRDFILLGQRLERLRMNYKNRYVLINIDSPGETEE